MAAQFIALIKPMIECVGGAFNKIADSKSFVDAVNQWDDGQGRELALKIIEESANMTDQEKLEEIRKLDEFVQAQKHEAASEINKHQIQMARIFIGILSAGISIPIEAVANAVGKKKDNSLGSIDLGELDDIAEELEQIEDKQN